MCHPLFIAASDAQTADLNAPRYGQWAIGISWSVLQIDS
jgi:hypothetical protein